VRRWALIAIFGGLVGAGGVEAQTPNYRDVGRWQDLKDDLEGVYLDRIIIRAKGASINTQDAPSIGPEYKIEDRTLTLGLAPPLQDGTGAFIFSVEGALPTDNEGKQKRLFDLLGAIKQIRGNDKIDYAVLSTTIEPQARPSDLFYRDMWNLQRKGAINVPDAWKLTAGSPDVSVAVLDTGILSDHPDVNGSGNLRIERGYNFVANNADATDTGVCASGQDDPLKKWHGSHIAGIIGVGKSDNRIGITGINHRVGITPIRIGTHCKADLQDALRAMRLAVGFETINSEGKKVYRPYMARIINVGFNAPLKSFEERCDPHTQRTITDVRGSAVIVVPAGNGASEGGDAARTRFGGCDGVLVAGAIGPNGGIWTRSNHADRKIRLVMAPGEKIWSYVRPAETESNTGLAQRDGTSAAAAHVSGVLALMRSRNQDIGPEQLIAKLIETAKPVRDCPGCGYGVIDAARAVRAVPVRAPGAIPFPPQLPDVERPRPSKKKGCKCSRCGCPGSGRDDDPGDDDDDDDGPDVVIIKKFYPCRPCGYDDDHGYRGYHGHRYNEEDD
jgi:subtilisin family serine protease